MSKNQSIVDRLLVLDKRILYWIMVIVMAIPFASPIGLPVPIPKYTIDAYTIVDGLPEGSIVSLCVIGIGTWGEMGPTHIAIMKHCMKNGYKVMLWGLAVDAPNGCELVINGAKNWIDEYGREYGVDYVNMGYVAGIETAVASVASDVKGTFITDEYGTPVEEISLFADLNTAEDFDLQITGEGGDNFVYFARHWTAPYGVKQIVLPTGWAEPPVIPYWDAGMVAAFATGLRGGASWEIMLKAPGEATIGMDAVSMSHITFLVFIIFGNILYTMSRIRGEERG
jgi:hypothetical protein